MECIGCESTNINKTLSEALPCVHCDGKIVIEYFMCNDCGSVWRAINNEPDFATAINVQDITNNFIPLNSMPEMDEDFVNRLEEELNKYTNTENASSMSDLIHKCIKCNAIVHEVKPGFFECVECGFSWEVIDFGE